MGSGASSKLFDITLLLKNNQSYSFSGIDKKELDIVMTYFSTRSINVKMVNENLGFTNELEDEDDSEDGDKVLEDY